MTRSERQHLDRVADIGCIVCRIHMDRYTPATIHHLRTGVGMGQKSPHGRVLPICPAHHQTGGYGVAYHAGREEWERRYGTEEELLAKVNELLAHTYTPEAIRQRHGWGGQAYVDAAAAKLADDVDDMRRRLSR